MRVQGSEGFEGFESAAWNSQHEAFQVVFMVLQELESLYNPYITPI